MNTQRNSHSEKSLSTTKARSRKLAYITALKSRQFTKNLILFAAPSFAFNISLHSLLNSLLAFLLFCCASSSFYLLNDIVDVECDRQYPVKCQYPIAVGLVSIPVALTMALVLLGSALSVSWWRSPVLGAATTAYAVLQMAYNLRLKWMVILDIEAIAI
ncbi:MAG: UbiA family prenyltransferase [Rhizonema sp. PD37]|nr:UbiA family prenyltransferase [Rhizonema sp. PD37]